MELIIQKIRENKEKIIDFSIIIALAICTCFIYMRFHAITDIYWDIKMGYKQFSLIALSDGRIIHYLLLNLANICRIPMEIYEVIVHITATMINCISAYLIYSHLIKNSKLQKQKYLILLGSFLVIFNPMNLEHYAYYENIVMSFSMLLCTKIAIEIDEGKKWHILKSIIMVIIAAISYQGTLNLFIALSILFLTLKQHKEKKHYIKQILKIVLVMSIALIVVYTSVMLINLILNKQQNRVGKIQIFSIKTAKSVINLSILAISTLTYNLFVPFLITIIILFTVLILAYQSEPLKKIGKYLLIILISTASCIIPAYLQKNPSISARMSCAIGSLLGISIIYTVCNVNLNNKLARYLTQTMAIILVGINAFNYWNVGIMNHKTMYYEQELAEQIGQVIAKYEKDNNMIIENIAFCPNFDPVDTYLNMPKNTFTDRALLCSYSKTHCLNYYLNKSYKIVEFDDEIYRTYFQDYKATSFEPEQVICKENTAYIYIY